MKNKLLRLIPCLVLLTSCAASFSTDYDGLIDEESINIISDINELAIRTFIADEPIEDEDILATYDTDFKPQPKSDIKEDIIKNVEKEANKDHKAKWVYNNFFNLPNVEAYLTGNDPDTIDFVYNLNNGKTEFPNRPGESLELGRSTPYFIQWDDRWGYNELRPRNIGISGCGPTSMAMIIARLKNDENITPDRIAQDADKYMTNDGISWTFFSDEAEKYHLKIKDINLTEEDMKKALKEGPLLVSVERGYFTLYGHIFVIDSYEDGKFIINDPNSIKNSMRAWTFDEIQDQILRVWLITS